MTSKPKRILVATRNLGKLREVRDFFSDLGLEVVGMAELPDARDVVEDGSSFLENARKKARALAADFGCVALADDSGLEVDALGGLPGVRSARYAGERATDEENNRKLLQALNSLGTQDRKARFRCVMVLAAPDGREWISQGTWEGEIAKAPRGSGGFGYDPVFLLPEEGRTVAELSLEEKNSRSHRAQALRGIRGVLLEILRCEWEERL